MTVEAQKETLGFQTEVKQLLHLMIHSLYSNKEIFLRELVSNASDALDKLRFSALENEALYEGSNTLNIRLEADKEAKTLKIIDNGIGMTRDEVIENLGTIAKSGTAAFMDKLTGDEKTDSQLIGQFGVGFYSGFIVADRVEVISRKAGTATDQGVHWESKGEGDFQIESVTKAERGTTIILHLKEDQSEFADDWRLKSLITKYSDHISFPVIMKEAPAAEYDEEGKEKEIDITPVDKTINKATALWARSKSEVTDEEYTEFYKHISADYQDPLNWSHNKVEGKLNYTSLLYLPSKAPFDLWNRDGVKGIKLYVQRVFIMDEAEQFLPLYLRFIKGVLDTNDLSLNVSREILQNDKTVTSIKSALTKRVLDMLTKLAKNDAEKYQLFWNEFGQVIKEGPGEDQPNKEKIAKLLRFSTTTASATQDQSLDQYIERMQEGQDKIYYIAAENYQTAKNSPHLEIFNKKGIEVLLLSDRVDEWLMSHLSDYADKQFVNVTKGELDLGETSEEEKAEQEKVAEDFKALTERVKTALGDQVNEVRTTNRLTDSPACLVVGVYDMGAQMRQIMEAAGQAVPEAKPTLEVNPEHPLVQRLKTEENDARFNDLVTIIFGQASLAEGGKLEDPAEYVSRLNKLLLELTQ